jgi:hypothetical protein
VFAIPDLDVLVSVFRMLVAVINNIEVETSSTTPKATTTTAKTTTTTKTTPKANSTITKDWKSFPQFVL